MSSRSRRPVGPRRDLRQDGGPVGHRLDRDPGVAQDLAPERVERPDADGTGDDPERRDGRIQPLGHLDRRPLVEGDRPDRAGGVPVAISQAARATSVVVLPLPAGAMHSIGPGGAVAAAR